MVFDEIYGSYYNVVAGILSEAVEGELSAGRIQSIIEEKAFLESSITIPTALKKKSWPLLTDECETPIVHKPTMPLTTLQKQWLKAICMDPRIRLFDPPVHDLEDVEPLYEPDFFVYYDRYFDGDPYDDPAYQEYFRLILLALRMKRRLRVCFKGGRNKGFDKILVPYRLEYSSKDDKFRLQAYSASGTPYIINLARVTYVELCEETSEPIRLSPVKKKSLTFILVDERNALERAMIHFSDLEKETVKLDDNRYKVTISYRNDDETEVLIRIISFGPRIQVISPEHFIELINKRLEKQKSYGF